MRTILIPTDYHISALDCIPNLCMQSENEELSFIFIHVFKLSDSINELLLLSRRSREFEQISDEFYERCETLKASYPQIKRFKMDFLYGNTLNMFKNFLEDNEVDGVLSFSNCSVSKINKSSIDPQVLIQKSGLPVINVSPIVVPQKSKPRSAAKEEMLLEA